MIYALIKAALQAHNISFWKPESNNLDWVVEIQAPKKDEPLKLLVNNRLNLDVYRTEIEEALRKGSFTYHIDVTARTYVIVH